MSFPSPDPSYSAVRSARRIAVFIPSLRGGGVERNMLNLTRGMADAGHDVDLVLARAEGPFLERVDPRVKVVDLRSGRVLAALPRLVGYLKEADPDALLSGMGHANIIAAVARLVARSGCRFVVSEHTLVAAMTGGKAGSRSRTVNRLNRWAYPRADGVVAVSRAVADDMAAGARLDPACITVIPNPVVTPELVAGFGRRANHRFFGAGQPPVILGVGRLSFEKGFDVLIRALPEVLRSRDARLLILGEGPERPALEALVAESGLGDKVDLAGFVEDVPAYVAGAAVLAMPSRIEGFGNALVEAMAGGSAVVAADCPGGPADILDNGRFGPLVAVDDPADLARGIGQMLEHPVAAEILEKRAADFSLASVTARYLELLLATTAIDQT